MRVETILALIPKCDYCGYKAMSWAKLKDDTIICLGCIEEQEKTGKK